MFFDSFEAFEGEVHDDGLPELAYIDAAPLKIGLAAHLAGRVKLRRAGAVGIAPADLCALTGNLAGACHSCRMVA